MKTPLRNLLLLTCLSAFSPAGAEIYRWVDEQGRTHFSDRAPQQEYFEIEGPADSSLSHQEGEELPEPLSPDRSPKVAVDSTQLIDKLIAGIQPGTPGVTDVFFVGFAGDAKQGVFMRETLYAKRLFEQQYNAKGRAFSLINHQDTSGQIPHANIENLGKLLRALGEVMDDEDVLYLYLTSHGSKDHRLVVDMPPHQYDWLSASALGEIMNASGIRYRVLVISACYSGGFVPALRSPATVVATAADAENTSFGCSDDNDFTWYGEAIFERQMTQGVAMLDALDKARDIVREMEAEQNYEHSNPQFVVGSEIREVVDALEPTKTE